MQMPEVVLYGACGIWGRSRTEFFKKKFYFFRFYFIFKN